MSTGLVGDDDTATSTLLADYTTSVTTATAGRTPMRTPATHSDVILQESQNILALTHGQTPLLGQENATLHASDFTGMTPAVSHPHPQTCSERTHADAVLIVRSAACDI